MKLKVLSKVDIGDMRKECLLTLRNIRGSQIALTKNVADAEQILKREQSMLSRLFQPRVNRNFKKRTASNDEKIEPPFLQRKKSQ
jgi:hypothetical protein